MEVVKVDSMEQVNVVIVGKELQEAVVKAFISSTYDTEEVRAGFCTTEYNDKVIYIMDIDEISEDLLEAVRKIERRVSDPMYAVYSEQQCCNPEHIKHHVECYNALEDCISIDVLIDEVPYQNTTIVYQALTPTED